MAVRTVLPPDTQQAPTEGRLGRFEIALLRGLAAAAAARAAAAAVNAMHNNAQRRERDAHR